MSLTTSPSSPALNTPLVCASSIRIVMAGSSSTTPGTHDWIVSSSESSPRATASRTSAEVTVLEMLPIRNRVVGTIGGPVQIRGARCAKPLVPAAADHGQDPRR